MQQIKKIAGEGEEEILWLLFKLLESDVYSAEQLAFTSKGTVLGTQICLLISLL